MILNGSGAAVMIADENACVISHRRFFDDPDMLKESVLYCPFYFDIQ